MRRDSGCSFGILQSPRPLWSFEHSNPWYSAHAWMRWCLRVAPHAHGESILMWLNTGLSRIYAHAKLHWRGVKAETCMYADGITLLHLGVVEHSVRRDSGSSFAIYCKPRVPCGRLSTLTQWYSAHAWMRWCLRVAPHALAYVIYHPRFLEDDLWRRLRMRMVRAFSCG